MHQLRKIVILAAMFPFLLHAQVFHFFETHTWIIKTTNQSPAHWYLEIYNDLNIEDTLRWKAHFVNCPSEWEINFDTQSGYWDPVQDGDSADFILMDSLDFPQKLIIGNHTNNTPGHGSVFFDIYDPQDPAQVVTIEYEFIISWVGIDDEENDNLIKITQDEIQFYSLEPFSYWVCNTHGQMMHSSNSHQGNYSTSALTPGVYLVCIQLGDELYVKKFNKWP